MITNLSSRLVVVGVPDQEGKHHMTDPCHSLLSAPPSPGKSARNILPHFTTILRLEQHITVQWYKTNGPQRHLVLTRNIKDKFLMKIN